MGNKPRRPKLSKINQQTNILTSTMADDRKPAAQLKDPPPNLEDNDPSLFAENSN